MFKEDNKSFRTLDIMFYLVFVTIVLLLIPLERFWTKDPYYFILLIIYFFVIHYTNRKFSSFDAVMREDYLRAGAYVLVTVVASYFFSIINVKDIRDSLSDAPPVDRVKGMRMRTVFLLYFIDISFNVVLGLSRELFKQRIKAQQVETEKKKAELAMYKTQINPHFMFNTLNTLYGLFISNSEKTGDVFLKFTDMIKYMYSNAEKESISVAEEVKYLNEFIDLHTLRLGEQTTVSFHSQIDDLSAVIPPVLLITFVENAFKYGVSSSSDSEIKISIELKNGVLNFMTQNTVFVKKTSSSGIGIENCIKRLDLLYEDNYTLDYGAQDNIYTTKLRINL